MRNRLLPVLAAATSLFALTASGAYAAHSGGSGGPTQCGNTDVFLTWSPTTLWPPNHKMQTITITGTDDDNDGDMFTISVMSITENPTEGVAGVAGCGQPDPQQGLDWSGIGNSADGTDPGTATTSVQVRSERCAANGDRTYDIKVMCTDECMGGGMCMSMGTADLTVTVPHDQGHH